MRLLLSATASGDGDVVDLAVDCDDDATVADIARQLAARVRPAPEPHIVHTAGRHLGVVGESVLDEAAAEGGLPPTLYLGGVPLDPAVKVAESPLRNGALVGVGTPLPDVFGERTGVVQVRTVSGPGAGRVDYLSPGSHEIGSRAGSAVHLHGEDTPPVAARLDVTVDGAVTLTPDPSLVGVLVPPPPRERLLEGPIVVPKDEEEPPGTKRRRRRRRFKKRMEELARLKHPNLTVDPEADRPFLHLDRVPVEGPMTWPPGGALVVGDVVLELALPADPDASLSPSPGGVTLDYNRPPRLLPPPRQTEFRLPHEPRKPDKEPMPWAISLAPMIMGGAMFWFTRSPFSLMIMIITPIMMISRYRSTRNQQQNRYHDDMKTYVERMRHIESQAYDGLVTERSARRRDLPDPAAVLLFATGPRSRLWERRRTDPDFMHVRVGTADVPSEVSMTDPTREEHERVLHWTAPDVPVGVPLEQAGVTGVAGRDDVRRQVAGWMAAQVAALHSPADVDIVVLSDADGGAAWNWMRWLPHVRRGDDSDVLAGIGTDDDTTNRRVAELMSILERRRAVLNDRSGGMLAARDVTFPPLLVLLDGARRIRLLPGLITLLRDGPRVNMLFLCIDADERLLPEECRAVVSIGPNGTATVRRTGHPTVEGIRLDVVPPQWCERLGRALAPVKDVSSEDLSSSLPSSSRLLDVLKLDPPTPEAIQGWWARVGRTTKAVIGEGMDGPFAVDIKADGPHGLVAGTTGSGKSELLQTLIASLAVANRPDEMTFVLVDYKGGAAFKDCNNLAHTVGMVTDLDGHLTTRALDSLAAELHRREHQLARAGKKDIEDYLAAKGPGDEPMPRLMIIIDEFAALVTELPDFVKGLVDIARRGRSLGVHLLLATQRPAGVVSAEIKSNTNLRIALRVTDANDSQDVIEAKDAAEISKSTPGRAYARLGASSLVPFQSSRVGGRPHTPGAQIAVDLRRLHWDELGRAPQKTDDGEKDEDVSTPTDLESLVTAINAASERTGIAAPPPPWLPPLDDVVTLDEVLADPAAVIESGREIRIPFGIVDVPREQRRTVAFYDLSHGGHLGVIGAPRSGRSTVLRAIAGLIGRSVSPRDVHLYGIDCGNNALLPMVGLPHTGAVVSRDQPERLSALSARIRAEIGRRQQLLAEQGYSDLSEQRAAAEPGARLPYLLVLFDRWEGFVQSFENFDSGRLIDQWLQILQEGAGVGVKVVMTADRTALVGRVSALVEDKLMLRMTDNSDFGTIGMHPKKVPEHMPPGRGFRAEGLRETQIALLTDDVEGTAQVAALQQIAREAKERHADVPRRQLPFRVDQLPSRISYADALALAERPLAPTELPVAVGGDTLTLRALDAIDHGPGILVLGPRRSGRSTTLLTMTRSMLERDWKLLIITPRRSPLRELEGRPGVEAVIGLEIDKDEGTRLWESMVPEKEGPPTAVVVDDLELMGVDGWMVDLLTKHLPKLRDTGSVIVAAGTTDDLGSSYRGPAAVLKKSRSGLLLSPAATADGDHFGIKLPRSLTGGMPPGRGLFSAAGQWQLVQVPETTVEKQ